MDTKLYSQNLDNGYKKPHAIFHDFISSKGRQTRPEVQLPTHTYSNQKSRVRFTQFSIWDILNFWRTPEKNQGKTILLELRQWIWAAACKVSSLYLQAKAVKPDQKYG